MLLNKRLGISAPAADPFAGLVAFQLQVNASGSPVFQDIANSLVAGTATSLRNTTTPIGGSPASLQCGTTGFLRFTGDSSKNVSFTFRDFPPDPNVNLDFTVEFWMRADTGFGTNDGLIGNTAPTSDSRRWQVFLTPTALQIYGDGDILMLDCLFTTVNVVDGSAHHVAWTRQGSTNKLWIDGVERDSYDDGGHSYGDTVYNLAIGEDHLATNRRWVNGVMDGVRITHACRYTATFTPPTLPLPAPT